MVQQFLSGTDSMDQQTGGVDHPTEVNSEQEWDNCHQLGARRSELREYSLLSHIPRKIWVPKMLGFGKEIDPTDWWGMREGAGRKERR